MALVAVNYPHTGAGKVNTNRGEWETLEWLTDADRLIRWTLDQDIRYPVMLVIRHSHRESSTDVRILREKRLTDLGHRMAFQFGERLAPERNIEIFFSRHPRCHETAQEIADGCNAAGGHARLVSDIRVLLGPRGSGDRIAQEMMRIGGPKFIKRWIKGELTEDIIGPIDEFSKAFIEETLGRLRSASENVLHIHVTHDLVLMGAKYILFGVMPTKKNWTPFLGGFALVMAEGQSIGYESGEERTIR